MDSKRRIEEILSAIQEGPTMHDDTDFGWDHDNAGELARLERLEPTVAGKIGEDTVMTATDPASWFTYFFIVKKISNWTEELVFNVAVDGEDVKGLGQASVQVALWRSPNYTPGAPRQVFWKFVFPRTGLVVSDSGQTKAGRLFWRDRISEALTLGKVAGVVETSTGRVIKFRSMDDYRSAADLSYGKDPAYANLRFFIAEAGKKLG